MRHFPWVAALLLMPQIARADCVYTGAKRAYLECIYNAVLANTSDLLAQGAALAGLDARVGDAETDLGALNASLAGTQGSLGVVEGQVASLTGELGAVQGDVASIQADLTAVQGDVGALQGDVDVVESDVSALSSALSLLEGALTALTGRVTTVEADVADLSDTVAGMEAGELYLDGVNVMNMFPFYRMTPNQILAGSANAITGWDVNSGGGVSVSYVMTINDNVEWNSRSAEERALLTAMGREGTRYIKTAFRVYRMSWTQNGVWSMYHRIPQLPTYTVAAFTRLESGSISGQWATGATSTWHLTGTHYGPGVGGYDHIHPVTASASGSILIAMPAAVAGWVDLTEPINWGYFPYVAATTTDQ